MRGKLANVDLHLHSSTKKILSLVKTLPDGDHLAFQLQNPSKTTAKEAPRRRFNRHPRLLSSKPSRQMSNESLPEASVPSLVVLKKPNDIVALTDSSDEFCDVTIRKDPLDPVLSDDNDISDQILESVQNRMAMKNKMKMETKDIKNAVNSQKDFVKGDCKGDSKVAKGPCKEKRQKLRGKSAGDVGSGDKRWTEKNYRVEKTKDAPKIFLNLKLRSIIEKSLTTLDDIRVLMEYGVDPPDGSEDYARRKTRATEFTTRFSRIHLYQLNRHITDIQNILLPTSDRSGGQKFNNLDLNQRFYTAHQTIFQGLQAYKKHLPSTVVIGIPDKFGEFLQCTSSLCDILRNNYDENPCLKGEQCIVDVLEMKCNVLYEDMQERRLMAAPILKNGDSRISLTGNCYKKTHKVKSRDSRYSMYQTIPKDAYWKKAIAALAKKKFNVSSKYKTATYKHRPQPAQQQRPFPSGEGFKSSKCESRKKSASKTINDMDRNVETQLQMQPQEDDDAEKLSGADNHVMWNIAQEIFEKIGKEQTMSQKEYECILEHFISMVKRDKTDTKTGVHMEDEVQQLLEERLGKPIEKMEFKEFTDKLIECLNGDENRKPPEPEAKVETGDVNGRAVSDGNLSSKSGTGIKERRQTISVTGLKNAQLICIKDDTSFEEAKNEEDAKKNSTQDLTHKESKKSVEDKVPSKGKLTRVQKSKQNLRQLDMLPKETIVDIIQYKLQFHKETKNNYMYKKSGNMSPWILMERIADKLLEESLFSIARDIQVDEILRKVFSQEFK